MTGHWELMGLVLDRAVSDVSGTGSPRAPSREFERRIGRRTLGNIVASGTQIIDDLGARAHADRLADRLHVGRQRVPDRRARGGHPDPELYRICEIAYEHVRAKGMGLGRVIARPFVGSPGAFRRTANRHDYALPPTADTLLDRLATAGIPGPSPSARSRTCSPGGASRASCTPRPTTRAWTRSSGAVDGRAARTRLREPRRLRRAVRASQRRRRVRGQPRAVRCAARRSCCRRSRHDDLLVLTADHGNDPTTPSTDHSREYVPLLVVGPRVRGRRRPRRRAPTFADLGQTLAERVRRRAARARPQLPGDAISRRQHRGGAWDP